MDENHSFDKLINDIIIYHQNLGLVICQSCKVAFPNDIERHFQIYHKSVTLLERRALAQHIQSLPQRRSIEEIRTSLATNIEIEAIKGLKIKDGLKCNMCHLFGADTTVEKHCRRDHGWVTGQRTISSILS